MPITILFVLFGLLLLVAVTAAAYKIGGLQTAIITVIGSLLALIAFGVIAVMLIASSMPN